ncbi:hypothetical protein AMATHDRAFT_86017 [Amanita thiersii Skay4041]|uniref:Ketosynthase family 3 (KS3) domain-containing protein n=1 Tax=Amanita thiersii Skay4041 TaxID=703135 RepID=A0A2A9NR16_9AGAR|nr:hypothetical protein AMATHDRAFT_86017 [Amanita thiersii Skay4041]
MQSTCIIGSACRLPGGIVHPDKLWELFSSGDWTNSSTLPPPSRQFKDHNLPSITGRGGWLGEEGVERFDASFFNISPQEASTLRPNVRLALELTWEALENAGIPPSSLKGKNVAVSFAVGTEDGWDMKRVREDSENAFNQYWASSSDPSGVAGRVSYFFDFKGPTTIASNACAGGAFALREGVNSLLLEDAEVAIVGALATHFSPAPFSWAAATGVGSKSGRSSAFASSADGYSPSEGAVVFVVKRLQEAVDAGDSVQGVIRAVSVGHNGKTISPMTPNIDAQVNLSRRVLRAARVQPSEVQIIEAHGTGTVVGDAMEAEAIRTVYSDRDESNPLYISASKTMLGHCHGAAALVGMLKVLCCVQSRRLPPHQVSVRPEFLSGPVRIPTKLTPMSTTGDILAQVNTFGFTGSIAAVVVQSAPERQHTPYVQPTSRQLYMLPFSAKDKTTLPLQIKAICSWALQTRCQLTDLSAALALCREHFQHRKAIIASSLEDLSRFCGEFELQDLDQLLSNVTSLPEDDRLDERFLNLQDPLLLSRISPTDLDIVHEFIKNGRIVGAACLLYDRGHRLAFATAYNKHCISPDVLRSLPFYQFLRKLHWRTSDMSKSLQPTKLKDPPVTQEMFEGLIKTYGAPFSNLSSSNFIDNSPISHILVTGANGMLGTLLLGRLLKSPNLTIHCIVRGEPLSRILQSFEKYGQDTQLVHGSLSRGMLRLYQTSSLSEKQFGLNCEAYNVLVGSIDTILHAAWDVNFNYPLKEFIPMLKVTRDLAQVCVESHRRITLHFISTYASMFNYPDEIVPEAALPPLLSHSLAQGYAISKLIAEHALLAIHSAHQDRFQLVVQRVGQICGDTITGTWNPNEMMPMLIASFPVLRSLPQSFPNVSWIPSDVCADSICDAVLNSRKLLDPLFLHIANPSIRPWSEAAQEIGEILGIKSYSMLSLQEFVDQLRRIDIPLPIKRLLPYFVSSLEDGTMPERYSSLSVRDTLKAVPNLLNCPPISGDLLKTIVGSILANPTLPKQIKMLNKPLIFVFGPWAGVRKAARMTPEAVALKQRLDCLINQVRIEIGDDLTYHDSNLDEQIQTLVYHLTTVSQLAKNNVRPCAVVGYCFGEYSAAIAAGAMNEEQVINVLIRRAVILRNIDGQMLNVFCNLHDVERSLVHLDSPPDIAIHVGPTHFVLSGSACQISKAKEIFDSRHIKNMLIKTKIAFHSHLMDGPILQMQSYTYAPSSGTIPIVSGVSANVVKGERLGLKYWQRHMRARFRFYDGVRRAREQFPGADIVDIGPGNEMTKVIGRYQWQDLGLLAPEDILSSAAADQPKRATVVRGSDKAALTLASSPPPSQKTVLPSDAANHYSSNDNNNHNNIGAESGVEKEAIQILVEMFGFASHSALLDNSPHAVGLQSLDFIRFSEALSTRAGVNLSLSAFTSDLPLRLLISETCQMIE